MEPEDLTLSDDEAKLLIEMKNDDCSFVRLFLLSKISLKILDIPTALDKLLRKGLVIEEYIRMEQDKDTGKFTNLIPISKKEYEALRRPNKNIMYRIKDPKLREAVRKLA